MYMFAVNVYMNIIYIYILIYTYPYMSMYLYHITNGQDVRTTMHTIVK